MGKMNFELEELSLYEQKEINGGNPLIAFFVASIVGGIVYEVTKELYVSAVKEYIDASQNGTYDGMPSPSFRH